MKQYSAKSHLAQLFRQAGAPGFALGGASDPSLIQRALGNQKPYYSQQEKDWIAAREKEFEDYNKLVAGYNEQLGDYQKKAGEYNAALSPYLSDVEAYNKALEDYTANVYNPYMARAEAYNKALADYESNVFNPYKKSIEDYNTALADYQTGTYNPYLAQVEAYNKAVQDYETNVYNPYVAKVDEYNRTLTGEPPPEPTPFNMAVPVAPSPFSVARPVEPEAFSMEKPVQPEAFARAAPTAPDITAPTRPTEPGAPQYTTEQFEDYVNTARNRAQKSASQRATAISVAANPEQFGLSGFGLSLPFAAGGPVSTDQFIRRANGSPEEGETKEEQGNLDAMTAKISKEERDAYFRKLEAELLQMQMGDINSRIIRGPRGVDVRASTMVEGVRPFVDVNPARMALERVGASYGNMTPQGGYDVTLSKQMPAVMPDGMVSSPTTLSGVYQRPVGKQGMLTAQGSYTVDQQRPNYQAGITYRQRFADGGDVSNEDFIQQTITGTGPRIMAQASQEPGVIRAKDLEGPATRSEKELRAYLQASIPDVKIVENPLLTKIGRRAEVDLDIPHIIMIDPTQKDKTREATLLHEAEHSRVGKAMQGVPENEQYDNDIRFDKLYGDTGRARLRMVQNFVKNKDKIEQFFGVPVFDVYFEKRMYENQENPSALFEEQIATLSALEQLTNKSITKGMPDLFPDDKAAAIYDAITGLRQTRLDAKDLPPNTPQYKSGLDWIKEKLRMRADGSPPEGEMVENTSFGEIKATPQNPLLGFLAKALKAREETQKGLNSPTGTLLDLILPTSKTVEKWSYGDPLFRMPPSGTGGNIPITTQDKGYVAETIGYAPIGFPAKAAASGALVGAPAGVIRPKGGGNLLAGEVERAILPLRPTVSLPDNRGNSQSLYASEFLEQLKNQITKSKELGEQTDYMERTLKDVTPQAALDDWIKNKFGNYVKRQMGTEDDPVRKLADEMSEKVQADYQAGLKRIAKMKDDIAKAKARGKNTDVSEAELADEIDRVETAFQEASILPAQLPPYTHVSSSLGKAREKAGFSPFEIAKTRQGKAYEELADMPFLPKTRRELELDVKTAETMGKSWSPNAPDLSQNPWISKLGEQDIVYRIRSNDINEKHIFTHTIDELRNALNPNSGLPPQLQLKPEDMQGLGIEKAFRHVNNINDWRMQQRIQANLDEAKRSAETIKEYPETPRKLKWQQLKPMEYTELPPGYEVITSPSGSALWGPDGKRITTFNMDSPISVRDQALSFMSKNDLEKALQYEGSTMRHCVGGYCDDVWTGQTNIFSLRDRKGEPHVTIETAPADIRREGNTPKDFILKNPEVGVRLGIWPKNESRWPEDIDTFLDDVQNSRAIIATPEFQQWLRSKPAEILQIKGKGNGKPKEEYMPFIQDFIKSREWSKIGDYKNANMNHINPDGNFASDLKRAGYDIPEYVTNEQYEKLKEIRARLLRMSPMEFNASRPPAGQTIGLDQLE